MAVGISNLPTDHPRSRGVYSAFDPVDNPGDGSSPLARGLRGRWTARSPGIWIIPARAGFTNVPLWATPFESIYGSSPLARGLLECVTNATQKGLDHPRSRGVYRHRALAARRISGSSPLARGLHRTDAPSRIIQRIIPARAGFTDQTGQETRVTGDHPRSRGVYKQSSSDLYQTTGSSPLARGLRNIRNMTQITHRIIPARAGFTATRR